MILFSYALLFITLTTFVVAAPPRSRFSKPEPKPEQVPTLPVDGEALLDAADYLRYKSPDGSELGWTRLPSSHKSVSRLCYLLKNYADRIRHLGKHNGISFPDFQKFT